jgi:hypothetical protein
MWVIKEKIIQTDFMEVNDEKIKEVDRNNLKLEPSKFKTTILKTTFKTISHTLFLTINNS